MRDKIWGAQFLGNWDFESIDTSYSDLLTTEGLWVRWVQEADNLTFYVSADGENWKSVIGRETSSELSTGFYINSTGNFGTMLTDVTIEAD